jgi:hypothetical protein
MRSLWLVVLGAFATVSGCAYDSVYERTSTATPSEETGPPVSTYPVPTTDPRGTVHVISLGAERLPVAAGQPDSYLHLRLAAENRADDATWMLDPNDQLLTFAGGSLPPSFAEASAGGPVLTVNKGAHGYLDVYYPAPPPTGPNRVTLAWKLRRGNELVAGTTDFDRIATPDPAYARYEPVYGPHVYVGLGLGWWWWPDYYLWGNPFWWHYPRYYGYYGGHGYYGGYYGGHGYYGGRGYYGGGGYSGGGYSGGRVIAPPSGGGGWRGGGSGGAVRAAPSGGGGSAPSGGKSGWRGGGRR